ncbi:MAG: hypothetical protein IJT32_06505 [Lachnospiraceae bacterium]|nr:hypothetical protein [Lachnospiraceae bacterium]
MEMGLISIPVGLGKTAAESKTKRVLPVFANFRRDGYDFDSRYEDGLVSHREKLIMDLLIGRDANGDTMFPEDEILSMDLKKKAGFGKGKEKVTVQQREAFTAERLPGNVNPPGEASIFHGVSLDASRICSAC